VLFFKYPQIQNTWVPCLFTSDLFDTLWSNMRSTLKLLCASPVLNTLKKKDWCTSILHWLWISIVLSKPQRSVSGILFACRYGFNCNGWTSFSRTARLWCSINTQQLFKCLIYTTRTTTYNDRSKSTINFDAVTDSVLRYCYCSRRLSSCGSCIH